jgi:hypothetical protein
LYQADTFKLRQAEEAARFYERSLDLQEGYGITGVGSTDLLGEPRARPGLGGGVNAFKEGPFCDFAALLLLGARKRRIVSYRHTPSPKTRRAASPAQVRGGLVSLSRRPPAQVLHTTVRMQPAAERPSLNLIIIFFFFFCPLEKLIKQEI